MRAQDLGQLKGGGGGGEININEEKITKVRQYAVLLLLFPILKKNIYEES